MPETRQYRVILREQYDQRISSRFFAEFILSIANVFRITDKGLSLVRLNRTSDGYYY
jgi:hypothetical protein